MQNTNEEVMRAVWQRINKPSAATLRKIVPMSGAIMANLQAQRDRLLTSRYMALLAAILSMIVALVPMAQGALYETPGQFETGVPTKVSGIGAGTTLMLWEGRKVAHMGAFTKGQCVIETFWFVDGHRMTTAEVARFLAPYTAQGLRAGKVSKNSDGDVVPMLNRNGTVVNVLVYEYDEEKLHVMPLALYHEIYDNAQGSSTAQAPTAPPPQAAPGSTPNDCLPVATEMMARLKGKATWARIAGFRFTKNGKDVGGHAVVFFQPAEDANVYMYDKVLGSVDLHTQSHELPAIIAALNVQLRQADLDTAGAAEWIGD